MDLMKNLLGEPDPTYLDGEFDSKARELLAQGKDVHEVAAAYPHVSYPWALLAQKALASGHSIAAYAYARTGYHRGLDTLRRAGWKGHGAVPADHQPNQGFLMCLVLLGKAAAEIGEEDEALRCEKFAKDCDPQAYSLTD